MIRTTESNCARTASDRKDSGVTIPMGLIQAERLVNIGFTAPAAVAVQGALFHHLRALSRHHGCMPGTWSGVRDLARALKRAGILDKVTHDCVCSLNHLSALAARGADVFRPDIEDAIEAAYVFVTAHPVPAEGNGKGVRA